MSFETLDLDNCSLAALVDRLTRIRLRGCDVEHWEQSDSCNGFHVTVSCHCGACRLVFDDATRYSKDVNRPRYAQNVLFQSRRRKLYLLSGNLHHARVPEEHVEWEEKDVLGVVEAGGLTDD